MHSPSKAYGIIVGADQNAEWLLPWWWHHFRSHNAYPVAFFDFGLSDRGKRWCQEKGTVIPIDPLYSLEPVAPFTAALWEKTVGPGIWKTRPQWFKKPFACLASPFTSSIWIDLDCEVRGSLTPLFGTQSPHFAIAAESNACQQLFQSNGITHADEITYNSGVVAYTKDHPILLSWIEEILQNNHLHIGDQNALSRVLWKQEHPFVALPTKYNWDPTLGPNSEALILHWSAMSGKKHIYEQIRVLASLGLLFP